MILLRGDLHNAWDHYNLAVNPDVWFFHLFPVSVLTSWYSSGMPSCPSYAVMHFIAGPDLRPLDDLFCDHFLQGVLKDMNGTGEPTWDYEDALGDGKMDLSRLDIWGGKNVRDHLEFEIAYRLCSC